MSRTNTIQSGTSSPSKSIINAENLLVIRNQRRLLEDVSASIENGKITLLLGHNGAGKTLFLWALHGLIEVDSGHIVGPPRQQQRMVVFLFGDSVLIIFFYLACVCSLHAQTRFTPSFDFDDDGSDDEDDDDGDDDDDGCVCDARLARKKDQRSE